MTELSLYEQVADLSTIKKQWFFDLFQGDALDTDRWTERDVVGTGSFTMNDSINGGYTITSGATTNNISAIDFNNIRQYDPTDAVAIMSFKTTNTSSGGGCYGGFSDGTNPSTGHFAQAYAYGSASIYYNLRIRTTGAVTSATDILIDTDFHTHKLHGRTSAMDYYIDNILKVTGSGAQLPTNKCHPFFGSQATNSIAGNGTINYMECYNV